MSAPRLQHGKLVPGAFKALADLNTAIKKSLDPQLVDLVFQRVSQINGCGYCVDLHWRDLVAHGESAQRLNSLITWRENSFFSARERAALAWTEAVTDAHRAHTADAEFEALAPHFSDEEKAALTYAIAAMNAWNRMGISMRMPVPPLQ